MSAMDSKSSGLEETTRALTEATRALTRLAQDLALRVPESEPERAALNDQVESLEAIEQALEEQQEAEAREARATRERVDLRRSIMSALRRGPALPVELAAVTLHLPEEIRPVLDELREEELVAIRDAGGGQLVTLTAKGRRTLSD